MQRCDGKCGEKVRDEKQMKQTTHTHTHTHRERERERERNSHTHTHTHTHEKCGDARIMTVEQRNDQPCFEGRIRQWRDTLFDQALTRD